MLDFVSPCGAYLVTVEDNGRVAYAYLKNKIDKEIHGYVWLYNRCEAPIVPEWSNKEKIPFLNPAGYTDESSWIQCEVKVQDVTVYWEYEEDQPVAYVYVFSDLYGVIGFNDKPGYARHATENNPLAKVMEIES